MDTDSLVEPKLPEHKIDDGRRLLKELERDGFEVAVALWARAGEAGKWRLYIASKEAETAGFAAYGRVYAALERLPSGLLSSSEVRVIAASDPFARDALKAREQHNGPGPVVYKGWRLGDRPVHGAYIYPPSPLRLTPDDVVARMFNLVQRPGRPRPSVVTLRDGSSFEGVPSGLEMSSGGPANVTFLDVATNQTRTLRAEEVVGID